MSPVQTTEGTVDLEPFVPPVVVIGKLAIAAIICVNVLNAYAIAAGPFEAGRAWYLLNQESNPSTWLSVMLFAGVAVLAGVCAVVDREHRRRFWTLVALSLLAMSLDDAATVHERIGGSVDSTAESGADLTYLWVVPWACLAVIIGVALWRLRPRLPAATRNQLVLGASIAIGAAVILEVVATKTVNSAGSTTAKLSLYSVEENLELIGTFLMGMAVARHARGLSDRSSGSAPATRR